MSTRRLTLIRHSTSEIRADVPASRWTLSDSGRALAAAFATQIDSGDAERVFTSVEPKARETAHALAKVWNLRVEEVPGLHEHERPVARMLPREEFQATIREMFVRSSELVFGAETADAARARFTCALTGLIAGGDRDVVVVSHGTVIALFAAAHAALDPFEFWTQLQMPCAVTFALPGLTLERVTFPRVRRNSSSALRVPDFGPRPSHSRTDESASLLDANRHGNVRSDR